MTIDLKATYETIDALQHNGHYDDIRSIMGYCANALGNDGEKIPDVVSRFCPDCANFTGLVDNKCCTKCREDLVNTGFKTQFATGG